MGKPRGRATSAPPLRLTLGIDESGRGPSVGPMVIAAVVLEMILGDLHEQRGLTELEEARLMGPLYREDLLSLTEIARRTHRHKSRVWRRPMLIEAPDPIVQTDVRLSLIAPRAAVAMSRWPVATSKRWSAVV